MNTETPLEELIEPHPKKPTEGADVSTVSTAPQASWSSASEIDWAALEGI